MADVDSTSRYHTDEAFRERKKAISRESSKQMYATQEGREKRVAYYLANRRRYIDQQTARRKKKSAETAEARKLAKESKRESLRAERLERKRKYNARWRKANPDRSRKHKKKFHEIHPEADGFYQAKRKAIKLKCPLGDLAAVRQWKKAMRKKAKVECYWCGKKICGKKCHFDHVVALVNGGAESVENYCTSCPKCNLEKSSLSPEEFNARSNRPRLFV